MAVKNERAKFAAVYRLSALRTINGFRTISDEAAYVIAGMMPIDILADEMKRVYDKNRVEENTLETADIRREENRLSLMQWQQRWDATPKGRWTHRLIPDIEKWISRKHGEVNYYLTQFLSNHGCFRKYLHRFGHDSSPFCPTCMEKEEDAAHILIDCPRFRTSNVLPNEENVVDYMLQSVAKWEEISAFAAQVLVELRRMERLRANSGE